MDWPDLGWTQRDAPEGFTVAIGPDGVGVLTIDRPTKRNALTLAMWAALPDLLAGLRGVRALLVTGAGTVFSAGADVAELRDIYADPDQAGVFHETNVAAEAALASVAYPTIAVVRGACVGGGCQLALACDLRIAARTARFGITPAKLGVVYPATPTARLTRIVGPARAKYLLFSADLIDADRALTFGLVEEVVEPEDLVARSVALGATIASRSRQSLGAAKVVIDAVSTGTDDDAAIAPYLRAARERPDVTEGLTAFIEGRPARFD